MSNMYPYTNPNSVVQIREDLVEEIYPKLEGVMAYLNQKYATNMSISLGQRMSTFSDQWKTYTPQPNHVYITAHDNNTFWLQKWYNDLIHGAYLGLTYGK